MASVRADVSPILMPPSYAKAQEDARKYQAKHAAGLTVEAKADQARLAVVRKRRADAAKKKEEEAAAKAAAKGM